ncbi:hypothetical protein JOD57_004142 [Geodermatophilus bullaregiensis]|uniref:hypothetical protein n=1 Tax=Geodermatophilus bullaregiensis TaxID=1564160 RepID=UPI001956047A|nr:hypothetical protein [Geodermatophilus bullaregiensis]MBM7808305.1 hypothetical protein [Geodermatophilus bullaregiensis]
MSGEIAEGCEQLLAAEAARRPTETIPEALDWALAWSLTGLPFEHAARWCDLPLPLADLPVAAAVATRHGVTPWLIEAWVGLDVRPTVGDIPVIGELQRVGWGRPALDLVATAGSVDASRAVELLARLLVLPPATVLDGIRTGLDLPAAVELAEYAEAGGATGQLLNRLLRDRVVSEELGARINVAITDIGDAMPTGLWATPAEPDARVIRSMRASLPEGLWAVFLSADEENPGPPEVDEANGGNTDAWTRNDNTWGLIDPPEDRAVEPTMRWATAHQVDALRRYLASYLRFLEPGDWVELSWPPTGNLTTDGYWSYRDLIECDEHGTNWDDDCAVCEENRDAWDHEDDPVCIHSPAQWDWYVDVQTIRTIDDGYEDGVDVDSWLIMTTAMDPREVRYL